MEQTRRNLLKSVTGAAPAGSSVGTNRKSSAGSRAGLAGDAFTEDPGYNGDRDSACGRPVVGRQNHDRSGRVVRIRLCDVHASVPIWFVRRSRSI